MWRINGIDISERFGIYLKKGAYDSFLTLPSVKSYITEDLRDNNGESVLVRDVRKCARSVSVPCYLFADNQQDFWSKYDSFVQFVTQENKLEFTLEKHNRTYQFIYEGCSDFSKFKQLSGTGKKYIEFTLSFREPDTNNVTKEDVLITESGQPVITEEADQINVNVNYY